MQVLPQLERLVWFHDQAKSECRPNASRLADRFEVSTKTAQRDITCLRDRFQAPLEYDPCRKGYYYTDEIFELPCLPAGQQEILCLLLARRLLDQTASGFISRELKLLTDKIFSGACKPRVDPEIINEAFSATWSGYSATQEMTFRQIAWALLHHRRVAFDYHSPQTDAVTQRITEPHHLQHYMASWVLTAWCRSRKAWRKFYLARMHNLKTMEQHFIPRPVEQWHPLVEDAFGLFQGNRAIPVTLRFTPFRSRWIRQQHWHSRQEISENADGSLELTLPVCDFREIKMKILQFGADCEVIAPEELRNEIRSEIEKMTKIYKQT
ncbi:MAG: WYL domain-containing protein [Desulfobacteraceae bacterium]|nr:WYL domain-containing protein [Desulfobacteraceae bacterium]